MSTMIAERFEVLSELERAHDRVVYRALDSDSGAEVLLLEQPLVDDPEVQSRLEEASNAEHVHAFTDEEHAYLVLEFELGDDENLAPALVEVLRRITAADPTERYQEASDILVDLRAVAAKTAPLKAPPQDTEPITQPAVPKLKDDLAATAPLAAPKPVRPKDLNATAPLALPKPVPTADPTAPVTIRSAEPAPPDDSLYFSRTKNFPKWSTVNPIAHGEFVIEFEMRDLEERRLEIFIVDKLEHLELQTFINREKRKAARSKRMYAMLALGALTTAAMYVVYAPIVPLVIVATLGGVASAIIKNEQAEEGPAMELQITPEELTLMREDQFRLRASPRSARWYLEQGTELMMATDRAVPVLELSRAARIQADWFQIYLEARCREIGCRRTGEDAVATEEAPLQQVRAQYESF